VTELGGEVLAIRADVTDAAAVDAAYTSIESTWSPVEILVNNAGVTRDGLILRMDDAAWDDVLHTNLTAAYRTVKRATPKMMRARFGRIINISSVVGLSGGPGQANYAAAKAGLVGFSRSLARELAPRNITVNVVAPGPIATAMTAGLDEKWQAAALAAGAVVCAGCSCLREARDDVALHLAVKRAQRQFLDPTCIPAGELCHYREGWREGYRDVATGLDGTPPVVPPKKYWNVSYVDPGCQHKIQLWYRGYADGALRAGRDGVQVGYFVPAVTSFDPPCNCQPRCASGCASGGMTEFETIELAPPSPPPIHEGEPLPSASLPGAELSTVAERLPEELRE